MAPLLISGPDLGYWYEAIDLLYLAFSHWLWPGIVVLE